MRKALFIALAAVLPVLGIAGYAAAGGGQSSVAELREATAAYHDIDAARAARYTVELAQTAAFGGGTCIANLGGPGAMGIHLVSPGRIDGNLVPTEPEALLYERRNNGTLKLTGVEYVVAGGPQPTLYGQPFDTTNLARFGIDATVWTLHAWVWKPNHDPLRGMFAPWNTSVTCD